MMKYNDITISNGYYKGYPVLAPFAILKLKSIYDFINYASNQLVSIF